MREMGRREEGTVGRVRVAVIVLFAGRKMEGLRWRVRGGVVIRVGDVCRREVFRRMISQYHNKGSKLLEAACIHPPTTWWIPTFRRPFEALRN